jgi:hypothetical protein
VSRRRGALARERLGKGLAAREAWTRVQELTAGKPEHAALAAAATEALARLPR